MDAVWGALVAGAVGQAIQPLVDRIARLEEAAVSNDQPATSLCTAEDPPENLGNTGEDGNKGATGSPPLAEASEHAGATGSLPLPSQGDVVGTSGSNTRTDPAACLDSQAQAPSFNYEAMFEAPDDRKRRPFVSDTVREKFEAYFRTGLEAKVKGQLLQKHPRPRTLAATTPHVDPLVERQIPQKDLRRIDGPLFEAQDLLLDAAGPFTALWDDVQAKLETKRCAPSELVVPADRLLTCVVAGMRLLGAANHRISAMRRERFLAELDKGLTDIGRGTGKPDRAVGSAGTRRGSTPTADGQGSCGGHLRRSAGASEETSDLRSAWSSRGFLEHSVCSAKGGQQASSCGRSAGSQPVRPARAFQNEGIPMLRDLFQEGDWLCKVDLKDAY